MATGTNYALFKNAPLYAQNTGVVNQFGVSNWFWGATVQNEPVLPQTGVQSYRLWRKATGIMSVQQQARSEVFSASTDYSLSADGWNLIIPAGSAVTMAPPGFTTTADPNSPYLSQSVTKTGTPLYLGTDYSMYQLAITYTTDPIVAPQANPLPRLSGALQNATPTAITFFGDSITQGGNASSSLGRTPQMPGFVDLVGAYLSTIAPGMVYWRNVSLSGMSSAGALQQVSVITDTPSDVVVIGFGMNDSSGNVSKQTFKANIIGIIQACLAKNSQTEFLLLSGITSNPQWVNNYPKQAGYCDVLHEIVGQFDNVTNLAVVDVTSVWQAALFNKSYYDVTANGVNHPGDFGHMLYAQTIIQALVGSEP